jgi:diguanylate cyclase (GGDEF)-like protein
MADEAAILDVLMATSGEAFCVVDPQGGLRHATPAFLRSLGLSGALPITESLSGIQCCEPLVGIVADVCATGAVHSGTLGLSGGLHELRAIPVVDAGAIAACIVALTAPAVSATGSREGYDALTGLPNRHLFLDRVEQARHGARRSGKSAAVLLAGIDRFGEVADVLGQAAADAMLREISGRLQKCVRNSDTVARYGGERFAFVMQIAAIDDSVLVTEKILGAFEAPVHIEGHGGIAVSCSVGVSIFPADGDSADDLIQHAAVALNHARREGGNRSQYFSGEMNARARHRLEVESGLRRALGNGEFLVYYQPKIDIGSRRVAGMEALVRWQDPSRGLVPPGEFIPVAEESGLIEQIGQWVLEETCAQNRRWQDAGLSPVRASVNVSARQFRNRNFVAQVEDVLARTGLAPCWLELEITESMLMGDIGAIVERMEDLRRVGVSLSIDDFGTGYSSLSYLSRFPITTLKIDRAFVADVQSNPHTAEIARAIIGLSRGLRLEVVAEGAEVAEQVEFLREHGCDLVQGYFYSRPVPADAFAVMLRDGVREPGTPTV